ncbi:hypothetical protein HG531_000770 [Fusarium graminearum]|nr:hypothetical protein HG531_000770 [Fusarium graminearum]
MLIVVLSPLALGNTLAVLGLVTVLALTLLGVPVVDLVVLAAVLADALLPVPVVILVLLASGSLLDTFAILLLVAILADTLLPLRVVVLVVFAGWGRVVVALSEELGLITSLDRSSIVAGLEAEVGVDIRDGLDRDGQSHKADQNVLEMHDRRSQAFQQRK